jgi:hypothetical protein
MVEEGDRNRLVGWVERNNTVEKTYQFDCVSETQHPHRLLLVGFPCVNPTYNNGYQLKPRRLG